MWCCGFRLVSIDFFWEPLQSMATLPRRLSSVRCVRNEVPNCFDGCRVLLLGKISEDYQELVIHPCGPRCGRNSGNARECSCAIMYQSMVTSTQ